MGKFCLNFSLGIRTVSLSAGRGDYQSPVCIFGVTRFFDCVVDAEILSYSLSRYVFCLRIIVIPDKNLTGCRGRQPLQNACFKPCLYGTTSSASRCPIFELFRDFASRGVHCAPAFKFRTIFAIPPQSASQTAPRRGALLPPSGEVAKSLILTVGVSLSKM